MTVLLLVVVIGRPLETYLQSLILVTLLVSEIIYECIRRPIRFPVVWRLQVATIATLILSLLCSMFKADFQSTASERGLQALGVLTVICNLVLCLIFLLYIACKYQKTAQVWISWGRRCLYRCWSGRKGFIRFPRVKLNASP